MSVLPCFSQSELPVLKAKYQTLLEEGSIHIEYLVFLRQDDTDIVLILCKDSLPNGMLFFHLQQTNYDIFNNLIFNMTMNHTYGTKVRFAEPDLSAAWYESYLLEEKFYPYDYPGETKIQDALFHVRYVCEKECAEELFLKSGLVNIARILDECELDPVETTPQAMLGGLSIKVLRILDRSSNGIEVLKKGSVNVLKKFFRRYSHLLEQEMFTFGQCSFLADMEEITEETYAKFMCCKHCTTEWNFYRFQTYFEVRELLKGLLELPLPHSADLECLMDTANNAVELLKYESYYDEQFDKLNRKHHIYEDNVDEHFFARLPVGVLEILTESINMSNCLSTYIERNILEREEVILFVRDVNKPDECLCDVHIDPYDKKIVCALMKYNKPLNVELHEYMIRFASRHGLLY